MAEWTLDGAVDIAEVDWVQEETAPVPIEWLGAEAGASDEDFWSDRFAAERAEYRRSDRGLHRKRRFWQFYAVALLMVASLLGASVALMNSHRHHTAPTTVSTTDGGQHT